MGARRGTGIQFWPHGQGNCGFGQKPCAGAAQRPGARVAGISPRRAKPDAPGHCLVRSGARRESRARQRVARPRPLQNPPRPPGRRARGFAHGRRARTAARGAAGLSRQGLRGDGDARRAVHEFQLAKNLARTTRPRGFIPPCSTSKTIKSTTPTAIWKNPRR